MTREQLVEVAHQLADTYPRTELRIVVVVTDASGDFVGVGMNTAGDDADRILRCAIAGEGLVFHDLAGDGSGYTRAGRTQGTEKHLRALPTKGPAR